MQNKALGNNQASDEERTDHEPDETAENVNPEENHSFQNLQVHDKRKTSERNLQAKQVKIKDQEWWHKLAK